MKIIIFLCTIALINFGLFWTGLLQFNNPTLKDYPKRGLDVSHHQGKITWSEIDQEGYSFVFIKATEGGDWIDSRFDENWKASKEAGFKRGAYHFYRLCTDWKIQAEHFTSVVASIGEIQHVVDLEHIGNCQTSRTPIEVKSDLKKYLEFLSAHYKEKPLIYTTCDFFNQYLKGSFKEYDFWIRDIFFNPTLPEGYKIKYWQYSNRGRVKGIDSYVYLNAIHP
jgi:lysozyme